MGVIMKRGINYTGSEGIELTQAEYDALSEAEKKNGTVYFITDGEGGGGGDVFDVYYNSTSFADVDKAIKEKKTLRFCAKDLGGTDITRAFNVVSYTWVPSENKYYLWYVASGLPTAPENAGAIAYCTIDNTNTWSAFGVFTPEDTGWQTLTCSLSDLKYRKKNGIVYVNASDFTLKGDIPVGDTIIGTMPAGFRPTNHCPALAATTFSKKFVGFIDFAPNGNIKLRAFEAITIVQNDALAIGFSYPTS